MRVPYPAAAPLHQQGECNIAFPGFVLDFDLPEGFVDTSCDQNETPSFDKTRLDGSVLRLWVDHADRSKSRLPIDEPYFRFSLVLYLPCGEWLSNLCFASTVQEALEAIVRFDDNF